MRTPKNFKPEQREAIAYGSDGPETFLLADVGYGKTVIGWTVIANLIAAGHASRFLVWAPLRVCRLVWPAEREQWSHLQHLRIAVAAGESAKKRREAIESDAHVVTLNYENMKWYVDQYCKRRAGAFQRKPPFDAWLFDEVDKMKAPGTSRFRAGRRIIPHLRVRFAMTGTPTPNHLHEIWGQAFMVAAEENGLGASYTAFKSRYFYVSNPHAKFEKLKLHIGAQEEIEKKLSAYTHRIGVTRDDPQTHDIHVDLSKEDRTAYDAMERDLIALLDDLDDPVVAKSAATKSNKLLQMASGFAYYENEGGKRETVFMKSKPKIRALEDLVSELQGKQLLIVYAYLAQLDMLREAFGSKLWTLEKGKAGDEQINAWDRGEGELLTFHPASAGHGLNLHLAGCHHLVYLTMPTSGGLYGQTNGRIDRHGQSKTVFIHRLIARGTHDEDVAEMLKLKRTGERALLEAMKRRTLLRGGR